jgi:hypothetical protein
MQMLESSPHALIGFCIRLSALEFNWGCFAARAKAVGRGSAAETGPRCCYRIVPNAPIHGLPRHSAQLACATGGSHGPSEAVAET